MEFAILGTVRITSPEGRVQLSGKQRAVLSAFLLHPNTTISRERLIVALWDSPPRSASANIVTYVHQLRRALIGTALRVRTEGSGYSCDLPPDRRGARGVGAQPGSTMGVAHTRSLQG
ncbi:winged helix-turn-helix domain-containing protein [Nonomuraea sp. NPDC049152]|uniref:AfsR/SARP family transcriptional regulator n=1 Tax=Nonomuraea sp. NPDC049152 TaxID=3154350 RepID=UPI0033ECA022